MTLDGYLSIGQLAAVSGRSRRTIDFYSRNGLLPFVRSEGGHRLFQPETIERLRLIDVYKASRLRLDEIRACSMSRRRSTRHRSPRSTTS